MCWSGFCIPGLTLDELAAIARRRTSAKVTVLRDLSRAQFEEHLRRSNDPARRYSVNFTRKPISVPVAGTTRRSRVISSPNTWCSCSTSTKTSTPG